MRSAAPGRGVEADEAWRRLLDVRTPMTAQAAGLRVSSNHRWEWAHGSSVAAAWLADLYAPLCLAGPRHAYAQLGQSLDGFIASRTGDAFFVTGDDDREHLHRLRALADAVVVGASTVLADDPRLTVRAVLGPNPARVVLDPRGRLPTDRRVFRDGAAPTLWLTGTRPLGSSAVGRDVEVVQSPADDAGGFAPARVLDVLHERGLGRVLVEGGGDTVSRFLHAMALHRLYLTVAPVLVGDGVPGIRFPGSSLMRDALRPPTRRFELGADVLFELDLTAR